MDNLLDILLLGLIQGLTEFLPVSSSGHLVLVRALFTELPQVGVLLETVLHVGSLVAVLVFLRHDIWALIHGLLLPDTEQEKREQVVLFRNIMITTAVTGGIGLAGKSPFTELFSKPHLVGGFLLITAVHLVASDRKDAGQKLASDMTVLDAIILGAYQALAICPGLSRSGLTLTCALFLGLRRDVAASYIFLISIPAILAAFAVEAAGFDFAAVTFSDIAIPYFLGAVVAGIVGYVTIAILLKLLARRALWPFAVYCSVAGVAALVFLRP